MKANEKSLSFLMAEGSVKIPFFQRGYVWSIDNWKDLLEDLLDTRKNAFLGSVILKQQPVISGQPKEVLVIDGQQRLTTLSILLKALYDSLDLEEQASSYNLLYPMLYYKRNPRDKEDLIKISHSHIDANSFDKIIRKPITDSEYDSITVQNLDANIMSNHNKILQCYKYYREYFKKSDEHLKTELFDRLLDGNKKILVVIDLDDTEDEQAIFDTINSAGVRLNGADIIKNALFQRAIILYGTNNTDVIELYNENWSNVFMKDSSTTQFWEATRQTGRLMRDNIEILLHSIAVINSFFDPDQHTLSDIPNLYKKHIATMDTSALKSFLGEIASYAKLYRAKILTFDNTTLFTFDNYEQRLFHILNRCEISTFHPYILYLYNEAEKNGTDPKADLTDLEKFILRRMVAKEETKSYNKLCKMFIANKSSVNDYLEKIDTTRITQGLRAITNKDAALVLFWIELHRRSTDMKESIKELKYNYSLEHIMPQKWEEYWGDEHVPYVDEFNNIKTGSLNKEERQRIIYHIGNMTLLNKSLNTSLRNHSFDRKINGEGLKKGIKAYSDLKITKDIVKSFEDGKTIWNEHNIIKRTKQLEVEFNSIWS